jgi:hypothetical protein
MLRATVAPSEALYRGVPFDELPALVLCSSWFKPLGGLPWHPGTVFPRSKQEPRAGLTPSSRRSPLGQSTGILRASSQANNRSLVSTTSFHQRDAWVADPMSPQPADDRQRLPGVAGGPGNPPCREIGRPRAPGSWTGILASPVPGRPTARTSRRWSAMWPWVRWERSSRWKPPARHARTSWPSRAALASLGAGAAC